MTSSVQGPGTCSFTEPSQGFTGTSHLGQEEGPATCLRLGQLWAGVGGGGGGGDRRLHVCDVDMRHKNLDTLERLSLSDGP